VIVESFIVGGFIVMVDAMAQAFRPLGHCDAKGVAHQAD
jgi:hypothetical protein